MSRRSLRLLLLGLAVLVTRRRWPGPCSAGARSYFAQYPYVKNLVPHNALYNYGRMQEVWLDK